VRNIRVDINAPVDEWHGNLVEYLTCQGQASTILLAHLFDALSGQLKRQYG